MEFCKIITFKAVLLAQYFSSIEFSSLKKTFWREISAQSNFLLSKRLFGGKFQLNRIFFPQKDFLAQNFSSIEFSSLKKTFWHKISAQSNFLPSKRLFGAIFQLNRIFFPQKDFLAGNFSSIEFSSLKKTFWREISAQSNFLLSKRLFFSGCFDQVSVMFISVGILKYCNHFALTGVAAGCPTESTSTFPTSSSTAPSSACSRPWSSAVWNSTWSREWPRSVWAICSRINPTCRSTTTRISGHFCSNPTPPRSHCTVWTWPSSTSSWSLRCRICWRNCCKFPYRYSQY